MAERILMPKAGITVEECIITEWIKQVGDSVSVGDILFHYETDKATFECESTASGEILAILYEDGDEVPVLEPVCVVGEPGEEFSLDELEKSAKSTVEDKLNSTGELPTGELQAKELSAEGLQSKELPAKDLLAKGLTPATAQVTNKASSDGDIIKISPRAKHLAEKLGVEPTSANSTGPAGRIIERDIRALESENFANRLHADTDKFDQKKLQKTSSLDNIMDEYEDVKFSSMRKATAKAMMTSLTTTAQVSNQHSYDVTTLAGIRKKIKESGASLGLENISYNDMIVYAVSRIIQNHPDLNAHKIEDNIIRRYQNVHIGIAVDTPKGLYVPVVRNANHLTLNDISAEIKRLATLCKEGNVTSDLFAGGTFTISNLGVLGVEMFTPVINPPQTAILGVCGITTRVRDNAGVPVCYPSMNLVLTYDHCVIDGSPASVFLKELCETLENFDLLMMK